MLKDQIASDARRHSAIKLLVVVMILTCFAVFFGLNMLDVSMDDFRKSYQVRKEKFRNEVNENNSLEAYNHWVLKGNELVKQKKYKQAYADFVKAQRINEIGKRANSGVTICLLAQCRQEGVYCKEASQYYETLVSSGQYSEQELTYVDSFK